MANNSDDKNTIRTRTTGKVWNTLKPRARTMRKNPTPAEDRLWSRLRRKQVAGLRFRRQAPIGQFIVDFYCPSMRLVIEVDGAIHDVPEIAERYASRQQYLESLGLRVVRFTNSDVLNELDAVIERIGHIVNEQP